MTELRKVYIADEGYVDYLLGWYEHTDKDRTFVHTRPAATGRAE